MDALKAYDVEEICVAGLYIVDVAAVFARGLGGRADEDYRSRTWCLSSVFRLGLRAKVAVI